MAEEQAALLRPKAGLVSTIDGQIEEDKLEWRLWREDAGASWTIVHELRLGDRVVRRDSWVNFKGSGLPPTGSQQGGLGNG